MENLILNAQSRNILGKQVKKLREQGKLPVVLYGREIDSKPLVIDAREFNQVFQQAGISSLVDLKIDDDKPIKVIIHDPQRHPISNKPIHADIYQVKMTEKIHTDIPLNFVGTSPAVSDLEGNLITNRDSLEVACLPDALVPSIDVDISNLKTFEDIIHVKDIAVPEGIEIINDPEETIALVTEPRSEEELAELEETTGAAEEEAAAVAQLEETEETKASAEPPENQNQS